MTRPKTILRRSALMGLVLVTLLLGAAGVKAQMLPFANWNSPPRCDNGLRDHAETDVDCGGNLCGGCALGKNCGTASDCASLACSGGKCVTPASCAAIHAAAPTAPDGPYSVDFGAGPTTVYCLMNSAVSGGGWTLVQRTVWDWGESSQLLSAYATWYGTTVGSINAGKGYRLAARYWPTINAAKDHLIVHSARKTDGSSCNPLYYMGTNGTWSVPSGGSATISGISQSVTIHNGGNVSTTNNGPSTNCVNSPNYALPWTYTSCCTTCPTFMGGYFADNPHPMASYLGTADLLGRTTATSSICGGASVVTTSGYYGINVMEYYLR